MKEAIEHFACKLKEDTFKTLSDQGIYWTGRIAFAISDVTIPFGSDIVGIIEEWLFYHGWLVLLIGRLILLFMDGYKRFRDVKKPEWDNIVKPVLKRESVQERKKSAVEKIRSFILSLFRF